ncbi:MAG: 4-hydroxybutyrate dehydrogenase [Prolixibacteraceae bacterium]|jgi:4-hydroxybutyrate dehydrogenase|nr:4-hydroxybutyrate dehydrogenase [Prolixibacteraceae bacterium]
MQQLKLKTCIHQFDKFVEFVEEFHLNENDLVLTNQFLFDPFMKSLNLPCHFIMQEQYGVGEPSDEMMNKILNETKKISFDRIIAIGGGTIIDISKLFVLKNLENVTDAFEQSIPLEKEKSLVIIPTTCGTGSEVTNISIAEIKSKKTKMGLANDVILADDAVLIPELLSTLPFHFYATSAIDALIHATEAMVSPKANPYTDMYSKEAIRIIIDIFQGIVKNGEVYRLERLSEILMASNYAGIAFGNAGVGAVHALSYPLGGTYHVPHGEANFQFFTSVFALYQKKAPLGKIAKLNELLSLCLKVEVSKVYDTLEELLNHLIPRKPLKEYGMTIENIQGFTYNVIETQQRLLANNYVELSNQEIEEIYRELY